MLVDSHCHLNFPDFKEDLEGVVQRARDAGVGVMQTICTEMAEFDEVYAIAERFPEVYSSVGVHPNDSGKTVVVDLDELLSKTKPPKVIGIGETGLDYHYETTDRETQKASFRVHIEAARRSGLPLIIHSRDADDDMISILTEEKQQGEFKALLHCFTSSRKLAEKSLELGLSISYSGIVTFKNAQDIRDTLSIIPDDRLLIETDAPFLAPVPNRGKRNEPSFVKDTNKIVAELKGISEEACATLTTNNFFQLFNKAGRPQ